MSFMRLMWVALLTFLAVCTAAVAGCGGGDPAPVSPTVPLVAPVGLPGVYPEAPAESQLDHTNLGGGDSRDVVGERPIGDIPPELPLASPSQAGCVTKLISHNTSSRTASPSMFVLHYTVSANRAGWSDMDAIWSWFNNSASQVSSHYIIDWEGHCYLIVPEATKAWTQGAFNSSSISIEFIATGSEPQSEWASDGDAGLRKGAKVAAASMKRWHIPLRYVDPAECNVVAGVTDHNALECGNSHHDVTPNFPWTKFKGYLAAAYHGTCYRFQIRDGDKVLQQSKKVRKDGRKRRLNGFLDSYDDLLLKRLGRDDHVLTLKQVKVVCG